MNYFDIFIALGSAVAGLLVGLYVLGVRKFDEAALREKARTLLALAEEEAKRLVAEAKAQIGERKKEFEIEQQEFAGQLDKLEKMFEGKSASHQKREEKIEQLKRVLIEEEKSVHAMRAAAAAGEQTVIDQLFRMTGQSREKIKEDLAAEYERNFTHDAELRIQRAVEWADECAVRDGRNILAQAMYRYAAPASFEYEEKNITVLHDEIKGRIIGRGGANIAFFEELFGVDVIFNDEPNMIIVSCFNLVQREIARLALERLMHEKNITEEAIARIKPLAEADVDKILRLEGEATLKILGLNNMPPDFAKLVGRLRFRTSYGQNIMSHCFEVGYFSQLLASEIGADTRVALLGGFFHDIGKAIDQEVGGSHDVLSKEILEKYNFSWEIVHAAWTHHNAIPQETIEARIVQAADAISAGRPGARAESVERYLAKIKDLQETAVSFAGVKKAYAINAGREVRVIVEPDKVTDEGVRELANNIAAKVQEKGGYPGKIKVVTIRTTKTTDYAK